MSIEGEAMVLKPLLEWLVVKNLDYTDNRTQHVQTLKPDVRK